VSLEVCKGRTCARVRRGNAGRRKALDNDSGDNDNGGIGREWCTRQEYRQEHIYDRGSKVGAVDVKVVYY